MKFTSLRLLKTRNFGLIWWSGFLSDAGTWMQTVAIGALVTELTDSAAWGSITAAVVFLLNGIVTPFAGVLADHYRKRMLVQLSAVSQAVLAILLAVVYATGNATPLLIVVFAALEGVGMAIMLPARGALIPNLVKREEVVHATALGTASWNLGRAIGPAFAGIVIAWGDYSWVFTINAITFVAIAFAVSLMRVREEASAPTSDGALTRLRAGLRVVRAKPGCRLVLIVMAVTALTVSPFIALVPAMAQLVFDGDAVDTAHFVMAQGVGAVVGAFTLGLVVTRIGQANVLRLTVVLLALSEIAYALAPAKDAAIVLLGVVGFLYVWLLVSLNTVNQLRAEPAFRGRAISLFWTSLSLFYPIGATFQGWLADIVGVRQEQAVGGATLLAIAVIAMAQNWKRFDVLQPAIATDQPINAPNADLTQ